MVTTTPPRSKGLSIGIWVAQVLLALAFVGAGSGKVFHTSEFAQQMNASTGLVLFIGVCELAGAVGLVLPAATRVKPWLTPVAALGLATIMVLAIGYHLTRGEAAHIVAPLVLGAVALFVAWGRGRAVPITPRA